jgi:hypothetical protein
VLKPLGLIPFYLMPKEQVQEFLTYDADSNEPPISSPGRFLVFEQALQVAQRCAEARQNRTADVRELISYVDQLYHTVAPLRETVTDLYEGKK